MHALTYPPDNVPGWCIISKLESTARYLWMEVDDALHIAEQTEL
jgi:hypothetical protein